MSFFEFGLSQLALRPACTNQCKTALLNDEDDYDRDYERVQERTMSNAAAVPNKWRKRVWRLTIASFLIGISFSVGVALTAYFAVRLLFPIVLGMFGLFLTGAQATTSALYSGDSATRLTVLTQLKQAFDEQPTMTFDVQTAEWILPAVDQCKTDIDPKVVALAEELACYVREKTTQPPP